MSTQYYGLPTVDPDSTLSFPDAVNGLANATDAVLHGIQTGFEGEPYDLPVASSDILGGVRVGDGFEVFSDGLLTTAVKRFELEPATKDKIGGVLIGKNMTVDAKGHLGVGSGAFADTNVKTENLVGGAVTNEKIADGGVVQTNLAPDVENAFTGVDRIWSGAELVALSSHAISDFYDASFFLHKINNKIALVNGGEGGYVGDNILERSDGDWHNLYDASTGEVVTSERLGFSNVQYLGAVCYGCTAARTKYFLQGICVIEINGATGQFRRKWYQLAPEQFNYYKWNVNPTLFILEG